MTKFSESIVGKIKCECIAPVPKWHFLFKSCIFWTFFVFSMILGSLSFSVIAHIASNGDLNIWKHLQGNVITSTVMLLPYFWFLSLILFAIIAYFNWRCTKQGYRFRRRWFVLGSAGLSIFFGSIFYAMGMGNAMDRMMVRAMPFYDASRHKARNELWLQPEVGLIMGKVVAVDGAENQLIIQDAQGKNWSIDENMIAKEEERDIKEGKIVKIIGKKSGENCFVAKEIRKCGDCQDDEEDNDNVYVKKNTDIRKSCGARDENKNAGKNEN